MTNTNRDPLNAAAVDQLLARLDDEIVPQSKILIGLLTKRTAFRFVRDVARGVLAAGAQGGR